MSNRIKELRAKQAEITAAARERLDQINDATDEARAKELEAQHDAAMAEYDRLEKLVEREEQLATLEQRVKQRREDRRPKPGVDNDNRSDDGEITYRQAFAKYVCGLDLEPEERAVLRPGAAKFEQRVQTAGTNSAGGFTVPTELANEIVRSMLAWGPMYDPGITREIVTTSGNPIRIPTVNDTTVSAVARTEGTALTDDGGSDATFGQRNLDAFSFDTEFVRWSWELDMDSIFNMEQLLGTLLGERLGRIANLQLTTGTGSSAPNGIVTASTLGITAVSTTAFTADELIDLQHSVDPAYRQAPTVRFMMNDTSFRAVRKLKDGQGQYLFQPGIANGPGATILGAPFSINQAMANPATGTRPIVFGDFGKYFVRKVGAPVIGVMRERFWPDLGIAGLIRFDGELADTAAVKHMLMA